jgi:ABC-type nitrate/sulfonate/bicarbonate transport system substrate-binding protein
MRPRIKRLLRKHGYSPDQRKEAVDTVFDQAAQAFREGGSWTLQRHPWSTETNRRTCRRSVSRTCQRSY